MSFRDYKTKHNTNLEEIRKQLQEASEKVSYEKDVDDWYPTVNKDGNAICVVRFMPALETEPNTRWVRWFSHSFKNNENGRYYIENSLTTFGFKDNPDPMVEYNTKLWKSTEDKNHPNRKKAQKQGRKFNSRVNVFVVSDSNAPTNNGQSKKWKFGKTFFKFIEAAIEPPVIEGALEQIQAIDPFDLIEGANLKILITTKTVDNEPTREYALSWQTAGPIFKDETKIEKLYEDFNSDPERWSLLKYIDKKNFKTYDALKERMVYVLGFDPLSDGVPVAAKAASTFVQTPLEETMARVAKETPAPETHAETEAVSQPSKAFFDNLQQEEEDLPWGKD